MNYGVRIKSDSCGKLLTHVGSLNPNGIKPVSPALMRIGDAGLTIQKSPTLFSFVFEILVRLTDQNPEWSGPEDIYILETVSHKNGKSLQHNFLKVVGLLGFEPRTKRL